MSTIGQVSLLAWSGLIESNVRRLHEQMFILILIFFAIRFLKNIILFYGY